MKIKFMDGYRMYKENELVFKDIEDAKEWFMPEDEGLKEKDDKIERCKDAFDLCEVLNEQESDSRWSYEEE
jgi:hypothetical protein